MGSFLIMFIDIKTSGYFYYFVSPYKYHDQMLFFSVFFTDLILIIGCFVLA